MPNLASQSCVAFASIASNTGSSSPGELEITCSTSEVAVCCSSASDSSRVRACTSSNSRTFSIAITAWSANVVTSSICFIGERPHLESRQYDHTDRHAFPQQWDAEHRVSSSNPPLLGEIRISKIGIGLHIGNMDDFALLRRAPKYRPPARLHRMVVHVLVVFGRVSVARHIRIGITVRAMDRRTIGLAKPRCRLAPACRARSADRRSSG